MKNNFSTMIFLLVFTLLSGTVYANTPILSDKNEYIEITDNSLSIVGHPDEANKLINTNEYIQRQKTSRKINEGEIKRHHELMVEEKKIEVLARLQMLESSTTNIYAESNSSLENQVLANQGRITVNEIK